jgi:large subunit ribosomal protein L6
MSRLGKKPVLLPEKGKAVLQEGQVQIEGPLGKLSVAIPQGVSVELDGKQLIVKRSNDDRVSKANHGLLRTLIANVVKGVTEGFKRELDISGVGYRAEMKGSEMHLALGFSHPVVYPIPLGIKATVEKQTHLTLVGADKQLVGQAASEIRNIKPPEPYKGKGVKYTEETVRRKAGKAAGAGAAKGGAK